MSGPRAKTEEEARGEFLDQIRMYVSHWEGASDRTVRERLDGLAFSILNIFDGTAADFPAVDIVLRPHPDDEAFCRESGEDWFQDGQVINNCYLHDLWYQRGGDKS